MCCAILTATENTMSTTQLMRAVCLDVFFPLKEEQDTQNLTLRMNWVVVTDANGKRQLKMNWTADRED